MAVSIIDRDRSVHIEHAASPLAGSAGLRLRMHYAPPQTPVLAVAGEVDGATAPRLAELVWSRLLSTLPALVLDLSEVRFLGLDGITLLAAVARYARYRGTAIRLVTRTRAVDRALHAGGLTDTLPRFATVAAAVEPEPASSVPMPRSPTGYSRRSDTHRHVRTTAGRSDHHGPRTREEGH